jgi:DNA-binding FadR family transcriptional regulator
MEFLILMDGISPHELAEFRSIMEPEIAALAAERATTDDLSKLQDSIKRHENAKDLLGRIDADLAFHQVIFDAAGNRACSRILAIIHKSIWKTISVTTQFVDSQKAVARHKAIYAAIHDRDSTEARRLMHLHIQTSRQLLESAATEASLVKIERLAPAASSKTRRPLARHHTASRGLGPRKKSVTT